MADLSKILAYDEYILLWRSQCYAYWRDIPRFNIRNFYLFTLTGLMWWSRSFLQETFTMEEEEEEETGLTHTKYII